MTRSTPNPFGIRILLLIPNGFVFHLAGPRLPGPPHPAHGTSLLAGEPG
jgi:hypothetical protein